MPKLLSAILLALLPASTALAEQINVPVERAEPAFDMLGQPAITVTLDQLGTASLAKFTADRIGSTIFIYAGGKLVVAPIIHEAISGGQFQISGGVGYNLEETAAMATAIEAQGSLSISDTER